MVETIYQTLESQYSKAIQAEKGKMVKRKAI